MLADARLYEYVRVCTRTSTYKNWNDIFRPSLVRRTRTHRTYDLYEYVLVCRACMCLHVQAYGDLPCGMTRKALCIELHFRLHTALGTRQPAQTVRSLRRSAQVCACLRTTLELDSRCTYEYVRVPTRTYEYIRRLRVCEGTSMYEYVVHRRGLRSAKV